MLTKGTTIRSFQYYFHFSLSLAGSPRPMTEWFESDSNDFWLPCIGSHQWNDFRFIVPPWAALSSPFPLTGLCRLFCLMSFHHQILLPQSTLKVWLPFALFTFNVCLCVHFTRNNCFRYNYPLTIFMLCDTPLPLAVLYSLPCFWPIKNSICALVEAHIAPLKIGFMSLFRV